MSLLTRSPVPELAYEKETQSERNIHRENIFPLKITPTMKYHSENGTTLKIHLNIANQIQKKEKHHTTVFYYRLK